MNNNSVVRSFRFENAQWSPTPLQFIFLGTPINYIITSQNQRKFLICMHLSHLTVEHPSLPPQCQSLLGNLGQTHKRWRSVQPGGFPELWPCQSWALHRQCSQRWNRRRGQAPADPQSTGTDHTSQHQLSHNNGNMWSTNNVIMWPITWLTVPMWLLSQ